MNIIIGKELRKICVKLGGVDLYSSNNFENTLKNHIFWPDEKNPYKSKLFFLGRLV